MIREFHPFPRLPVELRLQIWELVLRSESDVPGVHFISVQQDVLCDETRFPDGTVTQGISHPYAVVPNPSSEVARSLGLQHDPSSYRTDAGLWDASRESRAVIQKHFARDSPRRSKSPGSPIVRTDGDGRTIATLFDLPARDLFCFHIPTGQYFDVLSALEHLAPRDTVSNPEGKAHIAFEIDGDWPWSFGQYPNPDFTSSSVGVAFHGALYKAAVYFMWDGFSEIDVYLIDCQARLRPGAEVQGVFRAGGVRLLKVDRDQVVYDDPRGRDWRSLEKLEDGFAEHHKYFPLWHSEPLPDGRDTTPPWPVKLLVPERM